MCEEEIRAQIDEAQRTEARVEHLEQEKCDLVEARRIDAEW